VAHGQSEFLFALMANGIGEIPVQRDLQIFHLRIHAEMHALHRIAPRGDMIERGVQLREVFCLHHDVKFTELARPKAEFAAREVPAFDQPALFQVIHVARHAAGKLHVLRTSLQIEPGVIVIHRAPLSGQFSTTSQQHRALQRAAASYATRPPTSRTTAAIPSRRIETKVTYSARLNSAPRHEASSAVRTTFSSSARSSASSGFRPMKSVRKFVITASADTISSSIELRTR